MNPPFLASPTWQERLKSRFGFFLYKLIGVRSGPFMYQTWAGEWMLVDHYGRLYRLTYQDSQRYGSPITIELYHNP
jgi:hypothetical protein